MPSAGTRAPKWVLKIIPVAHGFDVYTELPTLAFYGHAETLEEAQKIAARQPTREEVARMLIAAS
jgi:hypothetical protein